MKQTKTRKKYFTPTGKAMRTVSLVVLVIAFVYLIVSHAIWPSLKVNGLFSFFLLLAYNVWLLCEVLCLYGGRWSKRTMNWLYVTTAVVGLALLLLIVSLIKVECASLILPLLIIGNILEYRVAGKMMKEAQHTNE